MQLDGERLVPQVSWLAHMITEELACLHFVRDHFRDCVVLDNGCGTGHVANFIAQAGARYVVGIDISEVAIQQATTYHQQPNLSFSIMNCLALGLASETFDFVNSLEVIEHLADTDWYLSGLHRVLKRGDGAFHAEQGHLFVRAKETILAFPRAGILPG